MVSSSPISPRTSLKIYHDLPGICMRRKDAFDRDALHFAPFLLLPSPFPRQEFNRAVQLQTLLNELMHKVSHDREFLTNTLAKTIEVDGFTGRLFEIYRQINEEGGSAQVNAYSLITELPAMPKFPPSSSVLLSP
jgi:hypothetical protein